MTHAPIANSNQALPMFGYPDEDMPLNRQDQAWIQQQIDASHNKRGGARVVAALKDWGALAVMLAIALAVLSQWTAYVVFRTSTEKELQSIDSQLLTLNAEKAPKKVLAQLASLEPQALSKNLAALRKVSEQPVSEVSPSNEVLTQISRNMAVVNNSTEDYWPSALQFIQFASAHYAINAPPRGGRVIAMLDASGLPVPEGAEVSLSGSVENMTFKNNRVIFTNGITAIRNVQFIDCVFEFQNIEKPSPYIEKVSHDLLVAGIQSATISPI